MTCAAIKAAVVEIGLRGGHPGFKFAELMFWLFEKLKAA